MVTRVFTRVTAGYIPTSYTKRLITALSTATLSKGYLLQALPLNLSSSIPTFLVSQVRGQPASFIQVIGMSYVHQQCRSYRYVLVHQHCRSYRYVLGPSAL